MIDDFEIVNCSLGKSKYEPYLACKKVRCSQKHHFEVHLHLKSLYGSKVV